MNPDRQAPPPFMTAVGGHVLIHDGASGNPLPEDWTGICVDGSDIQKFWFIGSENGERTYNCLQSTNLPTARAEVERQGFDRQQRAGAVSVERQR